MVVEHEAEDLVSGDGCISDDSSFYGGEDEQERWLSLCEDFNYEPFWTRHAKDLNAIVAMKRAIPPPDLHNIYEGRCDSWQLHESVDEFVGRLPPRMTPVSLCPWIWVANPWPDGRDRSGPTSLKDKLVTRGRELLQQSLEERNKIRNKNSQKGKGAFTRTLKQESEALKQGIVKLAEETHVLSGKWMLFPTMRNLTRVWSLVVEGTINNHLGIAAKVATDEGGTADRLICVYTKDFRDTDDILRVLKELVRMGLVSTGRDIYYKSDAYTYLDIYRKNAPEYGLQASVYSSEKMLA